MTAIYQTIFKLSEGANCLQAATASILDLRLEDVPNFMLNIENWYESWMDFIRLKGFNQIGFNYEPPPNDDMYYIGYYMVTHEFGHVVICKNGEVVHDPHPRKAPKEYHVMGYFFFK